MIIIHQLFQEKVQEVKIEKSIKEILLESQIIIDEITFLPYNFILKINIYDLVAISCFLKEKKSNCKGQCIFFNSIFFVFQ